MPYKDKEKYKGYQKKYQKNNLEKFAEHNRKHSHKRRLETLLLAGGIKCKKCGFDDWRALQVDHINACGNKNRLQLVKLREDIKKHPSKYQVLCANCNWIKVYENREHNHKY